LAMEKGVVRTRILRKAAKRKEIYETTHKELLQPGRDLARNRKGIVMGRWKGLEFFSSIGPYKNKNVLETKAKQLCCHSRK